MTAASMFVKRDAVILVTDTAFLDEEDGTTLYECGSKAVGNPELRIVLCTTGRAAYGGEGTRRVLEGWLREAPSQQYALDGMSDLAGCLREKMLQSGVDGHTRITIGSIDPKTKRARGWVVSTDGYGLGSGYTPLTLVEVQDLVSPGIGGPPLASFDWRKDGVWLLEKQRRRLYDGRHIVGGQGEVTILSRAGIRREVICRWPDQIGAPIEPFRQLCPTPAA